jgi:hypothetical protein
MIALLDSTAEDALTAAAEITAQRAIVDQVKGCSFCSTESMPGGHRHAADALAAHEHHAAHGGEQLVTIAH